MKPLFLYSGGKTKLLKYYRKTIPAQVNTYYELFLGGGAMFIEIMQTRKPEYVVLNDISSDIMSIYIAIRDTYSEFIEYLKQLESEYIVLPSGRIYRPPQHVDYFETRYEMCNHYRHHYARIAGYRNRDWWLETQSAAIFYFLLKTGFNGIYQTSRKTGIYFTPPGLLTHKNVLFDYPLIEWWHKALQCAILSNNDWRAVMLPDTENAFIFLDPPYRGSFTSYGENFTDVDQLALLEVANRFKRSKVLLSNRDIGDNFYENNHGGLYLEKIPVTYTAGRRKKTDNGYEAKPAIEVMLYN